MRNQVAITISLCAVLIGVISGCSTLNPEEPPPPSPPQTQTPEESTPESTPETTPQDSLEESSDSAVVPCSASIQDAVEEVIRAQTSALAAGDFEEAHSYATASFRLGVSVEAFEALIVSDYAPLLTATRVEFANCLYNQAFGAAAIEVQLGGAGDGVFRLRYVLFDSAEGWRVNEASNLESLGSES